MFHWFYIQSMLFYQKTDVHKLIKYPAQQYYKKTIILRQK